MGAGAIGFSLNQGDFRPRPLQAFIPRIGAGQIRLVQVEYVQDWLAEPIEQTGQKQAAWRTDPAQSGAGGSTGDIGTHAHNLAEFVSGLAVAELAADVQTIQFTLQQ